MRMNDLSNSQLDAVKREFRVSPDTFVEKAMGIVPGLTSEDAEAFKAEFATWPELQRVTEE